MGSRVVARQARQSSVDDVANSRYGQRSFGDIGSQYHALTVSRCEDPFLLGGRKAAEERQNLYSAQRPSGESFARFADIAFGG